MNQESAPATSAEQTSRSRVATICLSLVIAFAIIGYFIGIADGVPQPDGLQSTDLVQHDLPHAKTLASAKLIPAVTYAEIPNTAMGSTAIHKVSPTTLPKANDYDLFAKVVPNDADKKTSSQQRASRREFNGAPPIIPHAVENTSDAACYACHSSGIRMGQLKASVMSHQFLANCTQCHAPPPPTPFANFDVEVDTSFVGLPAPNQGQRAYPGAPPTIPHSQWMRSNCLACHGGANGWAGMESTHPWRTNCTQCHAPSATLDQAVMIDSAPMLPPLDVKEN